MNRHTSSKRFRIDVAAIVAMMYLLGVEAAVAHGGHEHPPEGGFDATVLLQAGGGALVIGVAYLAASTVYRRRDARRRDRHTP